MFSIIKICALSLIMQLGIMLPVFAYDDLKSTPINLKSTPINLGKKLTIMSKALSEDRHVFVRLPESYDDRKTDYPVIYLLDTNNEVMTYLDKVYSHSIANIERLMKSGDIPEAIVVGVSIPGGQWYKNVITKPELFRDFLIKELKPFIDTNYRTLDNNILIGQSYTGVFVVNTLPARSNTFNTLVAIDPILTGKEFEKALENYKGITNTKSFLHIFKSNSSFEEIDIFQREIAKINALKTKLSVFTLSDEDHGSVYYPALNKVLRMHFSDYRSPNQRYMIENQVKYQDIVDYHAKSVKKYQTEYDARKIEESLFIAFYAYLSAKEFDQAFKFWDVWHSVNKEYNVIRKVDNFLRIGDQPAAIALLNILTTKLPNSPTSYYRLAQIYQDNNSASKAEKQWVKINHILSDISQPEQERSFNSFGYQLLGDGDVEKSIDVFSKVTAAFPASINAFDSLGEAYEIANRYDKAVEVLSVVVSLAKKNNSENLSIYQNNLERMKQKENLK